MANLVNMINLGEQEAKKINIGGVYYTKEEYINETIDKMLNDLHVRNRTDNSITTICFVSAVVITLADFIFG